MKAFVAVRESCRVPGQICSSEEAKDSWKAKALSASVEDT